jgi:hypothetical protein
MAPRPRSRPRAGGAGAAAGEKVDAGMRAQRGARFFAKSGDHVERALGQSGFCGELCEPESRQVCILGRLEHRGISHGKGRRQGPADHLSRVVPRNDVTGHAMWLTQYGHGISIEKWNHLPVDFIRSTSIEFKIARQNCNIVPGSTYWPSRIARFELRQLFRVLEDLVTDADHNASTLGGCEPPPGASQRTLRGLYSQIDLMGLSTTDRAEDLSVHRRDNRNLPTLLS